MVAKRRLYRQRAMKEKQKKGTQGTEDGRREAIPDKKVNKKIIKLGNFLRVCIPYQQIFLFWKVGSTFYFKKKKEREKTLIFKRREKPYTNEPFLVP